MSLANQYAEIERTNTEIRRKNAMARDKNRVWTIPWVVAVCALIILGLAYGCLDDVGMSSLFAALAFAFMMAGFLFGPAFLKEETHEIGLPEDLEGLLREIQDGWTKRRTQLPSKKWGTGLIVRIGDLQIQLSKDGCALDIFRESEFLRWRVLHVMLDAHGDLIEATMSSAGSSVPADMLSIAERDQLEGLRSLVFSEIAPVDLRGPGFRIAGFVSPFAQADDDRIVEEAEVLQEHAVPQASTLAAELPDPQR
jgi:hypothetical protein